MKDPELDAAAEAAERVLFLEWVSGYFPRFSTGPIQEDRAPTGEYKDRDTELLWQAWKTSAAVGRPVAPAPDTIEQMDMQVTLRGLVDIIGQLRAKTTEAQRGEISELLRGLLDLRLARAYRVLRAAGGALICPPTSDAEPGCGSNQERRP